MPEAAVKPRRLLINTSIVPPMGFRYIQPESGKTFSTPNWRLLREQVMQHRRANGFPIGTDFDAELQDWICGRIPDSGMHCYEQGRSPMPTHPGGDGIQSGTGYQGQAKWRELHVWALTDDTSKYERAAWMANFTASLPCGECRREWRQLVKRFPWPQEGGNKELFEWSVEAHNKVNVRLGKKTISAEEARAIYA